MPSLIDTFEGEKPAILGKAEWKKAMGVMIKEEVRKDSIQAERQEAQREAQNLRPNDLEIQDGPDRKRIKVSHKD